MEQNISTQFRKVLTQKVQRLLLVCDPFFQESKLDALSFGFDVPDLGF